MNALCFIVCRGSNSLSNKNGTTSTPSMLVNMSITRRLRTVISTGSFPASSLPSWDLLTESTEASLDTATQHRATQKFSSTLTSQELFDSMNQSMIRPHSKSKASLTTKWSSSMAPPHLKTSCNSLYQPARTISQTTKKERLRSTARPDSVALEP